MNDSERRSDGKALLPFLVFIVAFLGAGVILSFQGVFKPFSQFPALMAAYLGAISAFLICKGSFSERLKLFTEGVARPGVALTVIIFMLAGAFSSVSKAMGGVDSIVNLCLTFVPRRFILMGIFFIGCIISFASGTSMGTVTTLAPIALGIVQASGLPLGVACGALLSGGCFGNQLSPVSDCSVAVTTGMGVSMKDKTRYNLVIAIPAMIIACALFMLLGGGGSDAAMEIGEYNLIKVIPYICVMVLAIAGTSVVICLSLGILLSGIIGLAYGHFTVLTLCQQINTGIIGMAGVILLAMVISGIAYMVDKMGGINFIVDKLTGVAKTSKGAHLGIAALTALNMLCIANDTVTIILTAPIAKDICNKFRIDPRAAAVTVPVMAATISPLCPWSGLTFTIQGLVSEAGYAISIVDTFPVTFYPIVLIIVTLIAACIPAIAEKVFAKPWDFEKDAPKA